MQAGFRATGEMLANAASAVGSGHGTTEASVDASQSGSDSTPRLVTIGAPSAKSVIREIHGRLVPSVLGLIAGS